MRGDRLAAVAALFGGMYCAAPALAQQALDLEQSHGAGNIEEMIVTASPVQRTRFDILQVTSVLTGEELERELEATIGGSLDRLPGLSQTSFGPGSSRPVIRGLAGDRLRVLIGGIGTFDVSTTSVDHQVAVDLSTAQRVEVVRGPSTLLYGNNAAAGVVNVIDGRIPTARPEGGFDVTGRALYGTNADEFLVSSSVDVAVVDPLVLHLDGFYRDTDNIEIPGTVRSSFLIAQDPPEHEEDEPRGVADNSDLESYGGTAGLSFVGDNGFLGVSVSYYDSNYGIPAELEEEEEEHGDAHEEEEEHGHGQGHGAVRVDLEQVRVDLMGELNGDFAIWETGRIRFGYADYEQAELEEDEVGTVFDNDEWEGRFEMVQKDLNGLTGAVGVQFRGRDFSAVGAEAFVPPNETFQYGFFATQTWTQGPWSIEAGARVDRQDIEAPDLALERDFTGISFSGGMSYTFNEDYLIGVTGHRTERAPNAEELFSNGPHLATFTFEIGDPGLGEETASGGEISLKKRDGRLTGAINAYYTRYDDFIFEAFNGEVEDGLPVAVFAATDAKFYGFEIEAAYDLWNDGNQGVRLDMVIDYVRAEDRDANDPLPRIPPLTVQAGAEYYSEWFDARLDLEWADSVDRLADFELPTDDYFLVHATLNIHPMGPDSPITAQIQARNLTDDEVRYHTSFLKDLVPAPGRDFRFSVKAAF